MLRAGRRNLGLRRGAGGARLPAEPDGHRGAGRWELLLRVLPASRAARALRPRWYSQVQGQAPRPFLLAAAPRTVAQPRGARAAIAGNRLLRCGRPAPDV